MRLFQKEVLIFCVNGKYDIQSEFRIFHLHKIFYSVHKILDSVKKRLSFKRRK